MFLAKWPQARIDTLIALADGTRTAVQIAASMSEQYHDKITPNAIVGKIDRMNDQRERLNLVNQEKGEAKLPLLALSGRQIAIKPASAKTGARKPAKTKSPLPQTPSVILSKSKPAGPKRNTGFGFPTLTIRTPSAPVAPPPRPKIELPDEKTALETLAKLFDFNAGSRRVESGPYAAQSPKAKRCQQATQKGLCSLALKTVDTRCAAHGAPLLLEAAGIEPRAFYEGAPAESQIRERLAAFKPS